MALAHGTSMANDGLLLSLDGGNIKSYPGTGTVWKDLLSSDVVTLGSGVTYSGDNLGVLDYDGTSNGTGTIATLPSRLNITSNRLTMSAWFNFDSLPSSEMPFMGVTLKYQLGLTNSTTIRNLIGTTGTSGWTAANDIAYTFILGNWYNMAATYDGVNMRTYVNGAQVGISSITGNIVSRTDALNVGHLPSFSRLNGKLGPLVIHNSTLTAEQVLGNYLAQLPRFS